MPVHTLACRKPSPVSATRHLPLKCPGSARRVIREDLKKNRCNAAIRSGSFRAPCPAPSRYERAAYAFAHRAELALSVHASEAAGTQQKPFEISCLAGLSMSALILSRVVDRYGDKAVRW